MTKQLALFEVEQVGEAYLPCPLDLNDLEHRDIAIAWQKKNSYPLFMNIDWMTPVEVSDWDVDVEWEVDFNTYFSYDDAQEILNDEYDMYGYQTETKIEVLVNNRSVHYDVILGVEDISTKEEVAETLENVEFYFQGLKYKFLHDTTKKCYKLYKYINPWNGLMN